MGSRLPLPKQLQQEQLVEFAPRALRRQCSLKDVYEEICYPVGIFLIQIEFNNIKKKEYITINRNVYNDRKLILIRVQKQDV